MSLDIGAAFRDGVSRSVKRNALLLVLLFVAVAFSTLLFRQTLGIVNLERSIELYQEMPADERAELGVTEEDIANMEEQYAIASAYFYRLPIPTWAVVLGVPVIAIGAEYASILATRVFGSDATETIPTELATRNAVLATLNGFVGGLVVWGVVAVGSVLFVVPGVFLAVSLYFLRQEIALEDKNFVQAMADSWRLTRGNRASVFLLLVLATVITNLWWLLLPVFVLGRPLLATAVVAVAIGFLGVVATAIVTRAYVQLKEADAVAETDDPYDAALGPDDIPE